MGNKLDMDTIVTSSLFLKEWKAQVKESLQKAHPDWDNDQMDDILNDIIKEELQLPEVTLDNNYTGESRDTTLLSVFDWILKRKPLVAGNATFYKNQLEAMNPIANMLDGFLKERKALKKKMFAVGDETSDLYKDLDRSRNWLRNLFNCWKSSIRQSAAKNY